MIGLASIQSSPQSQKWFRRSPGFVDTSLSKRFTVVGRSNAEFRWDAFNLFNHPSFGFPNQNFDSPTAGRITTTAADNRSMQFSIKFNF